VASEVAPEALEVEPTEVVLNSTLPLPQAREATRETKQSKRAIGVLLGPYRTLVSVKKRAAAGVHLQNTRS
jgi:hypothetical protein